MKDVLTSVLTVGLGIFVYFYSNTFADTSQGATGNPAMYPQIISILLIVLGVILLLRAIKNRSQDAFTVHKKSLYYILALVGILLVYLFALEFLGFVMPTILFLFVVMVFLGSGKKLAGLCSVGITSALYIVFALLFEVPLPEGILF